MRLRSKLKVHAHIKWIKYPERTFYFNHLKRNPFHTKCKNIVLNIFCLLYWFWVADFLVLGLIREQPLIENIYFEISAYFILFHLIFLLITNPFVELIKSFLFKQKLKNQKNLLISSSEKD